MCGVFIPDRVLAGWWRSQWKVSDPEVAGRCKQVVEGGRYISASAGGITVVYSAAVSFS